MAGSRFPSPYPSALAAQLEAYAEAGCTWALNPGLIRDVYYNDGANQPERSCFVTCARLDSDEVQAIAVTPREAETAMHAAGIARLLAQRPTER